MKRRSFVQTVTTAGTGFFIVPRHVLGRGFIPPSDKLNIAAIGVGGKGDVNIRNAFNGGTDNIVALCDVDDRMSKKGRHNHPKAAYYKDFRVMLDKEEAKIDAVMVSTPDHMHAMQTMEAMRRGKHVYVEKPLTHDIAEARMLTNAARKYKVVTQMGNQGASGDDTRLISAWIQGGAIGKVHTVHVWTNRPVWPQGIPTPAGDFSIPSELAWDLWLGTAPDRPFNPIYVPANWRGWADFGTGALGDMGCHFIDVPFMALGLGYPTAVECSVGSVYTGFFEEAIYTDSYPPSSKIHIQFPDDIELIWYDGGIKPKRPKELLPNEEMGEWDGGIIMEGSKGKLMAGQFGRNPTLLPTSSMDKDTLPKPKVPMVKNGREGHQQQWVKACKEGFGAYTSSPFDIAGPLTETVLMGNLAVRSYNYQDGKSFPGRKQLLWDGENIKVTNFEPANDFVRRKMKKSWKYEVE